MTMPSSCNMPLPYVRNQVTSAPSRPRLCVLHGLDGGRFATLVRLNNVPHRINDPEERQAPLSKRRDALLVGGIEHGRVQLGRPERRACDANRGERLLIERLK